MNEKKVDVKICVGTYSYVMGGSDLVNLESNLPEEWRKLVRVSGAISIPGCEEGKMKPPFASVNGKVITEANLEKITREIAGQLQK